MDHMMSLSRRDMLKVTLGLGAAAMLGGCGSAARSAGLPGVPWPAVHPRPDVDGEAGSGRHGIDPPGDLERIIARSAWTRSQPIRQRVGPMGGVRRITLHHEGSPDTVEFTDRRATADRLERIRRFHIGRGWGDIGYHYVVDRAGRIWQARPVSFQGAHVRDHNEHNIGVMCLGNFNKQRPSDAQLEGLARITTQLRHKYRVPIRKVHTHQELAPTSCPGKLLQPRIAAMRSSGGFA